jgi:hypothetical protein
MNYPGLTLVHTRTHSTHTKIIGFSTKKKKPPKRIITLPVPFDISRGDRKGLQSKTKKTEQ